MHGEWTHILLIDDGRRRRRRCKAIHFIFFRDEFRIHWSAYEFWIGHITTSQCQWHILFFRKSYFASNLPRGRRRHKYTRRHFVNEKMCHIRVIFCYYDDIVMHKCKSRIYLLIIIIVIIITYFEFSKSTVSRLMCILRLCHVIIVTSMRRYESTARKICEEKTENNRFSHYISRPIVSAFHLFLICTYICTWTICGDGDGDGGWWYNCEWRTSSHFLNVVYIAFQKAFIIMLVVRI